MIKLNDSIYGNFPTPQPTWHGSHIGWSGGYKAEDDLESWLGPIPYLPDFDVLKEIQNKLRRSSISSQLNCGEIFLERNETVYLETSIEDLIPDELFEHDMVIPLVPKEKYEIELEITSVRKAKHRIVEPDWI